MPAHVAPIRHDRRTQRGIAGSAGGSFVINEDGSYEFDPMDDFQDLAESEQRTTQVAYTVADGQGGQANVNLTVNVNN